MDVQLLGEQPPASSRRTRRPCSSALDAFEHTIGSRPLLVRSGGSIPIVPALAGRGIPAIVTGFALTDSNVHSPNERLLAEYLPLGVATAEEVLRRLGQLR